MKPDTILKLGDLEFSGTEIPESIPFGGEQRSVVHELVGGVRIVDAMGRADMPLEWSGLFRGQTAVDRALYLDGLRISGKQVTLSWDAFSYDVIVTRFQGTFERYYQVPYKITCTVVKDTVSPTLYAASPGIDDLVSSDMATANSLVALIGDSTLTNALGTLDTAIQNVSKFAGAVQSTINTVLTPLAAVQARVQVLIASTANVVSSVTTLGGILPNNPIAQQAAQLTGQVAALSQLPQLYNLQSVLGRMGGNLGSINRSANTVTAAGGNLFKLAADAYGDPTAWTTIARANNLTDAQLSGVNTLVIPPNPDSSGGVLSA